jgi:hypothetical protein
LAITLVSIIFIFLSIFIIVMFLFSLWVFTEIRFLSRHHLLLFLHLRQSLLLRVILLLADYLFRCFHYLRIAL